MSEQERDFLDDFAGESAPETQDPNPETPESGTPESPEANEPATVDKTPDPATPEADPKATTAKDTPENVPYAAMKAEREKRQALERKLAQLEQRIDQPSQQAKPMEFWDDPDAFVRTQVEQVEQKANQRIYAALEEQARQLHPDYDEVFQTVQEEAASNPAVVREIFSSPNPAMRAYELGKQLADFKAQQDPETFKAKLKAELLAEIKSEQQAEAEKKRQLANNLPPDLSTARSVGKTTSNAESDPFDELFPR